MTLPESFRSRHSHGTIRQVNSATRNFFDRQSDSHRPRRSQCRRWNHRYRRRLQAPASALFRAISSIASITIAFIVSRLATYVGILFHPAPATPRRHPRLLLECEVNSTPLRGLLPYRGFLLAASAPLHRLSRRPRHPPLRTRRSLHHPARRLRQTIPSSSPC